MENKNPEMLLHQKRFVSLFLTKINTIRKGKRDIAIGPLTIRATENNAIYAKAYVYRVEHKRFSNLTEEDRIGGGYSRIEDLFSEIKSIYPDISDSDYVTVIWFRPDETTGI